MKCVQLNHIYLVIDQKTYDAIIKSDLLQLLAYTYEEKNFADAQIGWQGFYIRGKNTFIEIFSPQPRFPNVGIAGIGMGVDRKGDLNQVFEAFKTDYSEAKKGIFTRSKKRWFEYVAVDGSYFYEKHSFWIMEYASDCFKDDVSDVSRARYNIEKYDPTKPFLDIERVSLALKQSALDKLSQLLQTSGLSLQGLTCSTSENIEICLVEEDESRKGIFQIDFSLTENFQEDNFQLNIGNSVIELYGKKGRWIFHFSPPH